MAKIKKVKHLWDYDHPYYCNEGNYYSNDCHHVYDSWQDFLAEWGDADNDYNMIFRWDARAPHPDHCWKANADDCDCGCKNYVLEVFYILQRKARNISCFVKFQPEQEKTIKAFLAKKWKHLSKVWAPLDI